MSEFKKLISKKEVAPGSMRSVNIDKTDILVLNVDGNIYAYEDRCPHMSTKLSKGFLLGNYLTCMSHGARFDVTTGKPDSVTEKPMKRFETKLEGDDIYINI
jgi:nitrite reductase/ring-hydroxylating ferredoxin subunit